ncbi:uncharacterized protein LOC144096947 [Amblyomma americanum]
MYTTQALPRNSQQTDVLLSRLGGKQGSDEFSVHIQQVAELRSIGKQAMVQALDIAIRHEYSNTREPVGRLLFKNEVSATDLGYEFVSSDGLFTSLRICEAGPLVNADVTTGFFYKPIKVRDLAERLLKRVRRFDGNVCNLNTMLRGVSIQVDHLHSRKYVIKQLTERSANELSFEREGQSITVAEYFRVRYRKMLEHPDLPCIDVGGKCYFPMELCTVAKFQKCDNGLKQLRKLEDAKKLLETKPQKKLEAATEAVEEVARSPRLESFFLELSSLPVEFEARELPGFAAAADSQPWMSVEHWIIVDACKKGRLRPGAIQDLESKIIGKGRSLNVNMIPPQGHPNYEWSDPLLTLRKIAERHPKVQIVFVILDKNSDLYSKIKYHAETEVGLMTQCIAKETMESGRLANAVGNVMRKVKAKMGGSVKAMPDKFGLDDAIIIGADVSHHGPQERDKPSVAAIVANIDRGASRYVATFRVQAQDPTACTKRVEIIADMKNVAKGLLRAYKVNQGKEPRKIIFYRDGVSEGQFSQVQQSELRALRDACSEELTCVPKITFITVQKRHKTRFLSIGNKNGNVKQGTVVDTTITHPRDFDFYLCSHDSRLGTARPAHYYVLCDENHFKSDALQELTYGLCQVYARCSTAVSIPAPVYYAHHAATRASCYLQVQGPGDGPRVGENSFRVCGDIENKMFFI